MRHKKFIDKTAEIAYNNSTVEDYRKMNRTTQQ